MPHPSVIQESFGKMPDGREVKIFTLTNAHGLQARVTEYGAILVSMVVPDAAGAFADITLGYDTLEGWLGNTEYFGATAGRFGNRIKDGKFTLAGKNYQLATNNAPAGIPCHLHGGVKGFDKVIWSGEIVGQDAVEFTYLSPDGDEGYPGNLNVRVTYTLTENNELIWAAHATTDAPTPINIVHHTYWNLSGDPTTSTSDHVLSLDAEHFLVTDAGLIPTGEIASVKDTPMDFTRPTVIGERVEADYEPLQFGAGYDHCWVLTPGEGIRPAARVHDPKTGRAMEVLTDQPAIQFYGGNFVNITNGKNGTAYAKRSGLCLETEGYPDAPNQPAFPSCILHPGEIYDHVLIHRFIVR